MALTRYEDWPARLELFFTAARRRPFAWGSWDCALFAAAGIAAITGAHLDGDYYGLYDSAESAQLLLKQKGHDDLAGAATFMLGAALPTPMKAQRGDVVMADAAGGGCLGILDLTGRGFMAVSEKKGLVRFPLRRAAQAWRV